MKSYKKINEYEIYKEGSWCEILKNGQYIYKGSIDENMTFEKIYEEIRKEVVFSLNGKELLSYDFMNEFIGERNETIQLLAEQYKCDEKDIKVSFRKYPNEPLKFDKAKFNTKFASDMKHNGEIVDIIKFVKGRDIHNDRYIIQFNDGTINDNIMSCELDFELNIQDKKVKKTKNREDR